MAQGGARYERKERQSRRWITERRAVQRAAVTDAAWLRDSFRARWRVLERRAARGLTLAGYATI
jgi:hypothetical protein